MYKSINDYLGNNIISFCDIIKYQRKIQYGSSLHRKINGSSDTYTIVSFSFVYMIGKETKCVRDER